MVLETKRKKSNSKTKRKNPFENLQRLEKNMKIRFLLNRDYSDKRVFSRTCSPTVCSGGGQECTRQAEAC